MNFNLTTKSGPGMVNLTFVKLEALAERTEMICRVGGHRYRRTESRGHL